MLHHLWNIIKQVKYHFTLGDTFFSENKFKEALTIYDMLIKLEPK